MNMSDFAKKMLVLLAFLLFSLGLTLVFLFLTTPGQTVNLLFAYVVGLSMIVLPCTLPLAFVIVPMVMNKGAKKGLLMTVFFGLGLSITLAVYGLFIGLMGQTLGLDEAIGSAGTVSKVLFMVGGLSAFIFGLSELRLISFKMPSYSGSYPKIIQEQGDYLKAFFLGLFLGNAGVGCPNPLFYVLLGDIAITGSMVTGAWLGFVHGIGRATPLLFLAILGLLGVNAVGSIAKKTALVTKITGVSLIILGAFIFIMGASHQWYENSIIHTGWNRAVQMVSGAAGSQVVEMADQEGVSDTPLGMNENVPTEQESDEDHANAPDFIPAPWSWITLLGLIFVPLTIYWVRERKQKQSDAGSP